MYKKFSPAKFLKTSQKHYNAQQKPWAKICNSAYVLNICSVVSFFNKKFKAERIKVATLFNDIIWLFNGFIKVIYIKLWPNV